MEQNRTLYLSNFWITLLFFYYFFLFMMGCSVAIFSILPEAFLGFFSSNLKTSIFLLSVTGSFGMALNGSSIFYIRKLYKLCFEERLNPNGTQGNYKEKFGSVIYFLTRPLFSVGFSILVVIGLNSGLIISSTTNITLGSGFIYECMFISFFVGFLTGNFIKNLETYGLNVIGKILK